MSTTTTAKKRKRAQVDADNGSSEPNVSMVSSMLPASQLGPVLVAYPAITPPEGTGFDYYLDTENDRGDKSKAFAQRPAIVQGEAPTVDFRTAQQIDPNETGSTYYIAIHNKRTKTTTFRPVPLHTLQRDPKALKALPSAAVSASDRLAARTALGGAFGTKKAQANLRAQERNKIDVAAMAGVVGSLQDRVQNNTAALPSKEEAKSASDASRPIPAYNLSAEAPAAAYPLNSIAPAPEWTALSSSLVQPLMAASTNQERSALLPERSSEWVWSHLKTIFGTGGKKPKRDQVKVVAYVSAMMAFRKMYRTLDNPTKLAERLHTVPAVCIEGMVGRFAQTARGAAAAQKTSEGETKLLTHIFALCLHADNFATDTAVLAKDLQMTVATVNTLFKALGCKVTKLSATDAKKLGLGDAGVGAKRAVLSVPLTFPDPRTKRKKTAGR